MMPWLAVKSGLVGSCPGWSALVGRRPKTVGGGPPGRAMSADLSHGRIGLSFLAEWPEEMPNQVLIESRSGTFKNELHCICTTKCFKELALCGIYQQSIFK